MNVLARILVTATLCVLALGILAQEPTRIATVISAKSIVTAIDSRGERRELTRRSPVFQGDTIETGEQGDIQLRFADGSLLALTRDGKLRITEYREDGQTDANVALELFSGRMRTLNRLFDTAHYRLSVPGGFLRLTAVKADFAVAISRLETVAFAVYNGGIELVSGSEKLRLGIGGNFNFAVMRVGEAAIGQDFSTGSSNAAAGMPLLLP